MSRLSSVWSLFRFGVDTSGPMVFPLLFRFMDLIPDDNFNSSAVSVVAEIVIVVFHYPR